ncbi:FAD-dependent oxidoreductase, partial [Alphaproteobacteria bacterium]|nr:FAD-dependent oxidoreductase [Alphaproteobacteria bacterium]
MTQQIKTDICVIGASVGGLALAVGMARLGAKVVLVDKGKWGEHSYGASLVSQAFLSSAHMAENLRHGDAFGVATTDVDPDVEKIHGAVHRTLKKIEQHETPRQLEELGIKVIRAQPHFTSPHLLKAGQINIHASRFVLATTAAPVIPHIPGIEDVPYFTSETICENKEFVRHLVILGGGRMGVEMAQAYRRLGAKVTLISRHYMMPEDDPDAVHVLREKLLKEGVVIKEAARLLQVKSKKRGMD